MSTRRKTFHARRAHKIDYRLPLCPDCQISMDFIGAGPLTIAGSAFQFELVCPDCKRSLSESVMNRKPQQRATEPERTLEKLGRILDRVDRLPTLDDRPADEILGYDENGVPR